MREPKRIIIRKSFTPQVIEKPKTIIYKKSKKYKNRQQKAKQSQRFDKKLKKFANELNARYIPSEVWFVEKFKHTNHWQHCETNIVLGRYIGDVVNESLKYVVEVDGSSHDSDYQKFKDQKKDHYLNGIGYKVFRVNVYSDRSYNDFIMHLDEYIKMKRKSKKLVLVTRISPVPEQGGDPVNKVVAKKA